MRLPEGAGAVDATFIQQAAERMDHRRFQRLRRTQRRQNTGHARGQHGFTRTRRADHNHVVTPGGRDFHRAFGAFLTFDIAQVAGVGNIQNFPRLCGDQRRLASVVAHNISQVGGADHLRGPDPGRFCTRGRRAEQGLVVFRRGHGGG